MVRKAAAGEFASAGQHQSAFPGQVSCERRGAEYAGVPEGIRLQGGPAHGGRERLSRVVGDSGKINVGAVVSQLSSAVIRRGPHFSQETREMGHPFLEI